ncbi:MAG: hypothetical protein M0R22_00030 [Dehalococcoidia bacterium]|nr:hypothetical protein [Dehalococcoidia bacterium]
MNWKENVDIRRREVARSPIDHGKFVGECAACEGEADNIHAYIEHGLCEECRDELLDKARLTKTCPRCTVGLLTMKRYFICGTCGLVVTRDPTDRVQAIRAEYPARV